LISIIDQMDKDKDKVDEKVKKKCRILEREIKNS